MTEAAAQREIRSAPAIAGLLSDERLARRGAAGDQRAFAAIFRRYHQSLYRFCLAILANPEDAQDALQNTMVKALRALPGEERPIKLKPWLYQIAHNESIDLLRRRRGSGELDAEQPAPGAGLAEKAAVRERLRRLLADLDELPERQRGALVMRELSGLDFDEIAVALGTSPAVARQTLYEARLSLRRMDEGREMSCQAVTRALSDGDGRVLRRRDVRAHLRACASCRDFRDEIKSRERDLGALSPLPAVGAAALLHGVLGGGGGSGSGGLAAALGGGAAKSVGVSALLKGAATVAVVAAIGVTAADRGGLIDVGGSGGAAKPTRSGIPAQARGAAATNDGANGGVGAAGTEEGSAADGAGAGLGTAKAAAAAGKGLSSSAATSEPSASSPAAADSNPSGRGHEKQHPSAAAKGQETAASHKAAAPGAGAEKGHPAHPSKPAQSASPPNHGAGKGAATSPPSAAGGKADSQAGAAEPHTAPEEAEAEHGSGKGP